MRGWLRITRRPGPGRRRRQRARRRQGLPQRRCRRDSIPHVARNDPGPRTKNPALAPRHSNSLIAEPPNSVEMLTPGARPQPGTCHDAGGRGRRSGAGEADDNTESVQLSFDHLTICEHGPTPNERTGLRVSVLGPLVQVAPWVVISSLTTRPPRDARYSLESMISMVSSSTIPLAS